MTVLITPQKLQLHTLQSTDEDDMDVVSSIIAEAFGSDGPGLILVNGLRESFANERLELFSAARKLALLGNDRLKTIEFPHVHYSVGWSRGREAFKGVADKNKGSFYANPIFDDPAEGDQELFAKYPHNMHSNCWPKDPSCYSIERYFKSLGRYINDIGVLLARHCDQYVNKHLGPLASFSSIEQTLQRSRSAKGRLLHYYPVNEETSSNENLWCGYHNDHGTITGLVSGAFFAEGHGAPLEETLDASAGLHVARGKGDGPEKVHFPADCLAFQIGESTQIASGGILKATPHAVKPIRYPSGVSRVALAVFLQPNPWDMLREPTGPRQSRRETLVTNKLVPPLSGRYFPGDRFCDFAKRTVEAYCM